jgi:hypothetical protein
MQLTGLTSAYALWVLPRVNVYVCSLLSYVAIVSSLARFGAQKVRFGFLGLPGLDRCEQHATPALPV